MMQQTFSDIEYSNRKRITKRETFLNEMDRILPWAEWTEMIEPFYPKGRRGRKPRGIETMLRMYLMQNWFRLSGEGMEDAVYDSYSMRSFLHLDFLHEQAPDASTLLRFRRLLRSHRFDEKIEADIGCRLAERGLVMHEGKAAEVWLGKKHDRAEHIKI